MLAPYWCFFITALSMFQVICARSSWETRRDMEREHDPEYFAPALSSWVNGSEIPGSAYTPDWRLREPPWYAHAASYLYQERDRPYRMSPHYPQAKRWSKVHRFLIESTNIEKPFELGCYCCTVYKRLTPLAGCAVLTRRNILTTATSTELVIRDRHDSSTLENILGLWYDNNNNTPNSSMYATPARIHYHPKYIRPSQVNASHPLPFTFDLAVWTTTYPLYYNALTCSRANSGWITYGSTVPQWSDMIIIVGFQFIRSLRKRPKPWIKYAVRTKTYFVPCTKQGWGWFHCIYGGHWALYGVESGAAWHRATRGVSWLRDGLAGMCAFSLRLRSDEIIHYFTVINTYPVLDFLYDSYNGWLPYEYLDHRFYNSHGGPPYAKPGSYIDWGYPLGVNNYAIDPPFYK